MNEYEITYLATPKLDESDKMKLDEVIDALLAKNKAEISYSSPTDSPAARRRLHYPIHDERVSWVRVIQAAIEPTKIDAIKDAIRKEEGIMRVTVLSTPRREEIGPELLETLTNKKSPTAEAKKEPVAEGKKREVTTEEVDASIEKALDEEVK